MKALLHFSLPRHYYSYHIVCKLLDQLPINILTVTATYFTAFGQSKTSAKKKHDAPWQLLLGNFPGEQRWSWANSLMGYYKSNTFNVSIESLHIIQLLKLEYNYRTHNLYSSRMMAHLCRNFESSLNRNVEVWRAEQRGGWQQILPLWHLSHT